MKAASIEIRITLVPHGYQIDITNNAAFESVVEESVCRDFAGTYCTDMSSYAIVEEIKEALENIERKRWLGIPPQQKGAIE